MEGACPAVMNAMVGAINREYGIKHVEIPLTPGGLWAAINSRQVGLGDLG